jgi:hypothetical protein
MFVETVIGKKLIDIRTQALREREATSSHLDAISIGFLKALNSSKRPFGVEDGAGEMKIRFHRRVRFDTRAAHEANFPTTILIMGTELHESQVGNPAVNIVEDNSFH